MSLIKTTPDEILLRAEAKLIKDVPGANEAGTWISTLPDRPEPPPLSPENGYEISMTGGVAMMEEHHGGGVESTHIGNCQLIVTIHSIFTPMDEAGRDKILLTDSSLGLMKRMTSVVKAFSSQFLLNSDGDEILSQPMFVSQFIIPPHTQKSSAYASVHFHLEWDWDLS